jgi:hypothetical protein
MQYSCELRDLLIRWLIDPAISLVTPRPRHLWPDTSGTNVIKIRTHATYTPLWLISLNPSSRIDLVYEVPKLGVKYLNVCTHARRLFLHSMRWILFFRPFLIVEVHKILNFLLLNIAKEYTKLEVGQKGTRRN